MGLPLIDITFNNLAQTAVKRSGRGIVAIILRDDTQETLKYDYNLSTDVDSEDWTAENLKAIQMAFKGNPKKVIVIRGAVADADYSDQLATLQNLKWNWLTIPGVSSGDADTVAAWIIAQRTAGKTFKAVLANNAADSEGVVNFATENVVSDGETYTAAKYAPRIAGLLAGLSLERSATYFVLSDVEAIDESTDPDSDIDAGKLILINQNEVFKIGRGVNSLTTVSDTKDKQFQKIKIVEGKDLIKTDITDTFNDSYVGQVNNSYDNQVLFLTAVNAYLRGLEGTVLDTKFDNESFIDVAAQREALESIGTDTTEMSDQEIRETSFQSKVFLDGNVKFLDAMEDLAFKMSL